MPYRNIADRRRVSRESARRRRQRLVEAAEAAAVVSEAAADSSPGELGAVLDAPERSPDGASVQGPGDGGRIAPGHPHNDLTAVPGAIEDGPAPLPVEGGEFVTLTHRCVRCRSVSEIAVPPIEGLGEVAVSSVSGLCSICAHTPADPAEPPPVDGAAPPPSVSGTGSDRGAAVAAVAGRGAQGDAGRLLGADSR